MIIYDTCPYEYRKDWKVLLIPWEHTEKEFYEFFEQWKEEHFLQNFDKLVTFDFLPNPTWEDGPE